MLGFLAILRGTSLALDSAGGNEPNAQDTFTRLTRGPYLVGPTLAAPGGIDAALGSQVSVTSATLSISGTSTMHPYTVSTKALKVSAAIASAVDAQALLQPGALQGFELQIPVNTFTSDKDGLTKQMFKAIKADKHPTITFRLNELHGQTRG